MLFHAAGDMAVQRRARPPMMRLDDGCERSRVTARAGDSELASA